MVHPNVTVKKWRYTFERKTSMVSGSGSGPCFFPEITRDPDLAYFLFQKCNKIHQGEPDQDSTFDLYAIRILLETKNPVMWIRFRIGMAVLDPDPYCECKFRSGSRSMEK
jgi:hypothetical protein